MKVLILGHTGFVGSNVLKFFRINNIDCKGVSRASGVDLRDSVSLQAILKDYAPNIIVNCAAHVGSLNYVTEYSGDVINNNTKLILSLYEAVSLIDSKITIINPIANCGYPGESLIYKEAEWLDGPVHESVLSYGSTRRLLVAFSDSYRSQYNISSINLFVPNMYGENDSTDPNKAHALNALVYKFVKAYKDAINKVDVWGTGSAIREWLYVQDFAKILYRIIVNKELQEKITSPINIAQNSGLSIKELVDLININYNNFFLPEYDVSKPDGAPKKIMDDSKFRSIFKDFIFENFETGIKNTINYYESIR
jgi:GDP-L-fucose synthase